MRLIIDTREQTPIDFSGSRVFSEIITKPLSFGDYWCEHETNGQEVPIVFERKSHGDLYGSLSNKERYLRLKRGFTKAKELGIVYILLIEASMTAISKGYIHSERTGSSVLRQIFMMFVRYNVIPIFTNDSWESRRLIEEIYDAVRRNYKYESKNTDS